MANKLVGALIFWLCLFRAVVDAIGLDVATADDCFQNAFPKTRAGFPALLNCLGLVEEAVEVGVQAGVHAQEFISSWKGRRLRLVDKWSASDVDASPFYVDIANIHGFDVRRQHRAHCERRLSEALEVGRAEIIATDSAAAAATLGNETVDFVYLDARHDFAGAVADVQAWWPKVRVGGILAGHDFVDGEFPEGDFFWVSALNAVLPGLNSSVWKTQEPNLFKSFFVFKTEQLASMMPLAVDSEVIAHKLYTTSSPYFSLWRRVSEEGGDFQHGCQHLCDVNCTSRKEKWTLTRSAGSTLRPFACGGSQTGGTSDTCGAEMVVDSDSYYSVCLDRCGVTCVQRAILFKLLGNAVVSV